MPDEYEEFPVFNAAKRCGLQWCPWMGDHFTSWSPRNSNTNAEGSWAHWANLAAMILAHPFTENVAPHLYRPDLKADQDMASGGPSLPAECLQKLRDDHEKGRDWTIEETWDGRKARE